MTTQQPGVITINAKTLVLEQQLRALVILDHVLLPVPAMSLHMELFEKVLSPTTHHAGVGAPGLAFRQTLVGRCAARPLMSWKALTGLSTTADRLSHRLDVALTYSICQRISRWIVDLGCGNGVIGLTLLDKTAGEGVVDESPMALLPAS